MYSSIVIILIIIFFSYTIYVILQQKRLSEIRTDFVNNMTHELKTPISTIGLSAEAIISPSVSGSPERVKQYVNIIRNENSRLRSQVDRVLQIASLSPRKAALSQETIDLHEVLRTASATFEVQAAEQDGTLSTSLDALQSLVKGDRVHLTNVVYNLLDNAIKYSPENPKIHIRTFNRDNRFFLEISDNGIGINKANQKLIFEKFYRVPTGNLHAVRGYGLGLFYVKAIIKSHGGKITLTSEPGKGSTFQIQLKCI
jgi:two-component system phosphate regulon sensor histidine kinase PhoR